MNKTSKLFSLFATLSLILVGCDKKAKEPVEKGEPTQQNVIDALENLAKKDFKSFSRMSQIYRQYYGYRQEITENIEMYNDNMLEINGHGEHYPNNGSEKEVEFDYVEHIYEKDGYVYDLIDYGEENKDSNDGSRQEINIYHDYNSITNLHENLNSVLELFKDPAATYPEEVGYYGIEYAVEVNLEGNYEASIVAYADAADYYSDEDHMVFVELDKYHNVVGYGSSQYFYNSTDTGEGGRETGSVSQSQYIREYNINTSKKGDFSGEKLDPKNFDIQGLNDPIDLSKLADGEISYENASQIVLDMNHFAEGTSKTVAHEEVTTAEGVKTVTDYTASRYNNYIYEELGSYAVYNSAEDVEPASQDEYTYQRSATEEGVLQVKQGKNSIDQNVAFVIEKDGVTVMEEFFNPSSVYNFNIGGLMKEAINTGSGNTGFSITTITASGTKTGDHIEVTVGYKLEWLIAGMGISDHVYKMTIENGFVTKIEHNYDNNGEIEASTYTMVKEPLTDYKGTLINKEDVELPEMPY